MFVSTWALRGDLTAEQFEREAAALGLCVKRMAVAQADTLHWHLSMPSKRGTLEATRSSSGWELFVRSNRAADWQAAVVKALLLRLE